MRQSTVNCLRKVEQAIGAPKVASEGREIFPQNWHRNYPQSYTAVLDGAANTLVKKLKMGGVSGGTLGMFLDPFCHKLGDAHTVIIRLALV